MQLQQFQQKKFCRLYYYTANYYVAVFSQNLGKTMFPAQSRVLDTGSYLQSHPLWVTLYFHPKSPKIFLNVFLDFSRFFPCYIQSLNLS